jgi:hypothetical protein
LVVLFRQRKTPADESGERWEAWAPKAHPDTNSIKNLLNLQISEGGVSICPI